MFAGTDAAPDRSELDRIVDAAVAVFLGYYG
jgi:hypothetical protein